jgi:hypothetical protein
VRLLRQGMLLLDDRIKMAHSGAASGSSPLKWSSLKRMAIRCDCPDGREKL